MSPSSDTELLKKIASKDKQAFEAYYKKTITGMRKFIYSKGLTSDFIIDDICQDVFVKVWNKAPYYNESKGAPKSWLATITQNTIYDYWRKTQRLPGFDDINDKKGEKIPESTSFRSGHNGHETWLTIDKALASLKEDDREMFMMIYFKGYTIAQYAEMRDIPEGTVKWRMSQVNKSLRKEVEK